MEIIISHLQSVVEAAVPMIVLLGVLIFVHELGHFLVAKYFKVRVEVFSLGFGPKLIKFKRGDTVYTISAIPLGGYVKMFGDDPSAEVAQDQKAYSFTNKPVGQRIAVVLAGPLMNLFFAWVVFTGVAGLGDQVLAPKLGDVDASSYAYASGFRNGDAVISVNGDAIKTWDELQKTIEANADHALSIVVERGQDAKRETFQVTPKLEANKNVLSWERQVGEVDGLSYSARAAVVGVRDLDSIAGQAGLRTGDIIDSVNGIKISRWSEFKDALNSVGVAANGKLSLEVERGLMDQNPEKESKAKETTSQKITLNIGTLRSTSGSDKLLAAVGIEFPELYLAVVEKKTPAANAGLKKGDRLLSIDGQTVSSFDQVAGLIRSFGQAQSKDSAKDSALAMVVERDGKDVAVSVAPNMINRMNTQMLREEKHFEIGIRPLIPDAQPATFTLVYTSPVDIFKRGMAQTIKWTSLTVLSFVRLFQAEVSPKNLGGLFSIGQMAKRSWLLGLSPFLNMMGIISINLFILNLLPVPVLDGGHLVFYSVEALRGAPLSMRKMEIAQQVGLVLLLCLMGFALFNDFTRIFGS